MDYSHAPVGYACPFCRVARQLERDDVSRTIYKDDAITAFVSLNKWANNPGHVIIIPNQHYENIYDLPPLLAARIHECAQAVSKAMKVAYSCDGITTRQHNEPAGGQDVWHYHLHVFPRYKGDALCSGQKRLMASDERAKYAQILRAELKSWKPVCF